MQPREDCVEQIEQQAADWLARRTSDDWSESDEARLARWLEASTARKVAFLRLEAAWSQVSRLKAIEERARPQRPASLPSPLEQPALSRHAIPWRQFQAASLSAAAVLVLILGAVAYFRPPAGSSFQTPIGAVEAVPMRDGSRITLNTDSQVRIAVTDLERRVDVSRGEAFFEVASDPKRPFVVVAGHCRVVAVGTKFSVWREADNVRVVVTEGRVRVEHGDTPASDNPIAEVSAGSIAHAADAGVLIEHKRLSEVEEELGWRRGFVFFHDLPLAEAVAELNRYNTERIVIGNPAIAGIRIGGSFRSTNVSGFVRLLQDGFAIHVEQRDGQIILTGGG